MTERRSLYKGSLLDFGLEVAALPNGERVAFEIARHPGGAAVAAVDENQNICLIRQFRYAVDDWVWELPAGVLEMDEAPELAARRELKEETGVTAKHWRTLGKLFSTPGFCDETLHLYLATSLTIGQAQPEPTECIEVHWVALNEAASWALNGAILDGKTIAGVLRAQASLAASAT